METRSRASSQQASASTSLSRWQLLIYPVILLLGSLFSVTSPLTRLVPFDIETHAHIQSLAPSYFARKSNLFNLYFVKQGWAWTVLAFVSVIAFRPHRSSSAASSSSSLSSTSPSSAKLPPRVQAFARLTALTLWWVLVTQWCFGPALMDRSFEWTGGLCAPADPLPFGQGFPSAHTETTCRAVGGRWRGGHDLSGHVFLLVLGSAALVNEVIPLLTERRRQPAASQQEPWSAYSYALFLAGCVIGLSWWMLLMTAVFFHTWLEKTSGLIVALIGIFGVYWVPTALPSLGIVFGSPDDTVSQAKRDA